MSKATAIACVFVDVGGVLLTDGWDHRARKRAASTFKLKWAEMEQRHRLTFETYEEGRLSLEEYLGHVVFYQERAFTRAQFRHFMFAQSRAFPEMIDLVARLKVRHGLKIAVISNEGRELNHFGFENSSSMALLISLFLPVLSAFASPMQRSFGSRWTSHR